MDWRAATHNLLNMCVYAHRYTAHVQHVNTEYFNIYIYVYVCMYVCMYVYIYITYSLIYIYIHICNIYNSFIWCPTGAACQPALSQCVFPLKVL